MSSPKIFQNIKNKISKTGDTIIGDMTFSRAVNFSGGVGDYEGGEVTFQAPPLNKNFNTNIHTDVESDKFRIHAKHNDIIKTFVLDFNDADGHEKIYHSGYKPAPEDIGALSLNGGTLTGGKISLLNGKGYISASNTLDIAILDTENDTNNRRILSIYDTNTKVNLKDSLLYVSIIDGKMSTYTIYGTHNKPTAADVGALSLTNGGTVTGNIHIKAGYGGPEGGQFSIAKPENQHNFQSDVIVDVYTNQFRVFSAHNNATKVFNFDFNTLEGHATVYHTQNIRNGSGSTPSNLPDQGIYIRY